jgi:glycosyltransferase involved in cell wall biosynthesis
MDWRAACAAVIPCFNEGVAIGALVTGIREQLPRVIVIDDGSSDDTAAVARRAGAMVLENGTTLGKGAALQVGWTQATKLGALWALNMDGDGQHCPADIPSFLQCADRGTAALIVGNRMNQPSRIPLVRRWVNRWMSRRLSNLTRQLLPDSQCGFRLMNLEAWRGLPVQAKHFEIESEMLVLFASAGLGIEFIPIQVIYKQEQSKIHPLRDTVRWLRWYQQARRRR